MALTASTHPATPWFNSGALSFSALRSNFKETSSGPISASELRRNTNTSSTNPIVPDSTENSDISSGNNLKLSQFRDSIKYYDLDQGSGDTDTNLNIATASLWNNNLGKTIVKRVRLAGTSGSSNGNPAASLDASSVFNVIIIVSGSILGTGGAGATEGVDGGDGGHALYIDTNGTGTVTVRTTGSTSRVYGGGGGGGFGGDGGNGGTGKQTFTGTHYWANTGCVGNNMPCQYSPNFNSPIPCDRERCNAIRACGDGINYTLWQKECWDDYEYTNYYSGGTGGTGGEGGDGEGYLQSREFGIAGTAGTNGGTNAGAGGDGGSSGRGGDWGEDGVDGVSGENGGNGNHTNGTAGTAGTNGGTAGRAVAGSGYSIDTANGVDSAYRGVK
jgi:hypothetical protein